MGLRRRPGGGRPGGAPGRGLPKNAGQRVAHTGQPLSGGLLSPDASQESWNGNAQAAPDALIGRPEARSWLACARPRRLRPKGGGMRKPVRALLILAVVAVVAVQGGSALAFNADTRVTVGSPVSPFSPNKQNEPAVAIDANHPGVLAAGANDNIDLEACNAGTDNTCPFTDGVGVSGISFSFNNGTRGSSRPTPASARATAS